MHLPKRLFTRYRYAARRWLVQHRLLYLMQLLAWRHTIAQTLLKVAQAYVLPAVARHANEHDDGEDCPRD